MHREVPRGSDSEVKTLIAIWGENKIQKELDEAVKKTRLLEGIAKR